MEYIKIGPYPLFKKKKYFLKNFSRHHQNHENLVYNFADWNPH